MKNKSFAIKPVEIRKKKIDICDMCVLKGESFIGIDQTSVIKFEDDFDYPERVFLVIYLANTETVKLSSIALNKRGEIYITDYYNHCIFMLTPELAKKKIFGSKGVENNELSMPNGISCNNDYVYVCDTNNSRIQILSLDLQFFKTFKLNYCPDLIKVSSSMICISTYEKFYFYNLNEELVNEYPKKDEKVTVTISSINEIDSYFYAITYGTHKIVFFYDKEGKLIEEIDIDRFPDFLFIRGIILENESSLRILSNDKYIEFV
jgi:hypothetical protein